MRPPGRRVGRSPAMARQRGIAIITVLFVVALAAALAYGMAERQTSAITLSRRMAEYRQAREWALAAEAHAMELLRSDVAGEDPAGGGAGLPGGVPATGPAAAGPLGSRVDGLGDSWAQPHAPFPVENGYVEVRIRDLQGCFNLNSLLGRAPTPARSAGGDPDQVSVAPAAPDGSGADDGTARGAAEAEAEAARARTPLATLKRLLANLGLEENLADAFRDWIDEDGEVRGFGAEDGAYLLADEPFRAGNQPFRHLSEVAVVEDVDLETMAELAPHVCVLPVPDLSVNVNTASAAVLGALAEDFGPDQAEDLARPETPWQTVADFTAEDPNGHLAGVSGHLSVASQFFEITVEAGYGRASLTLTTRVFRDGRSGEIAVIDRDLGRDVPAAWETGGIWI